MRIFRLVEQKIYDIREWEAGNTRRQRRTYWCLYVVSFIVMAFASFIVYPLNGASLVWSVDGMEQFYPYFVYEGQWLREIASNIASGNFSVPMWAFDLGYGADIFAEMDVFFDPLNLLSGICPERYSEWLFQFLVVFRLFLAGWAFSLFSLHFKNLRYCTLLASLVYALSGTALSATHWPGSTWPLILFPLLLLGVEKILDGKQPYLFVITSAFFFAISWYFAYMACIFLIIYCAARVVLKLKKENKLNVRNFLLWAARLAWLFIIGAALAGIALWPMLTDLATNERARNVETVVPLVYSFTYYMDALTALIGTASVGSDCFIGFGGFAFLACILMLVSKKEGKLLKVTLIAMLAILFIPACGSALNGFNYATNRWVWAFALLVCMILAKQIPNLLHPQWKSVRIMVIASCLFVVAVFVLPWMRNEKTVAACVVLMAALAVCAQRYTTEHTKRTMLSLVLLCSIVVNAFYFTCPEISGTAKETPAIGTMYSKLTTDSCDWAVAKATEENGDSNNTDWRYDADPACGDRPRNNSLTLGLSGIDFYNSLYNGKVDKFHTELGLAQGGINFSYQNLTASTMTEILCGVKYYMVPSGKARALYGYGSTPCFSTRIRGQLFDVYKAENTLGKAFTYSSCIPKSEYDKLTPLQRQEALLQAVVVDDTQTNQTGVSETQPEITSQSVDFKAEETVNPANAGTTEKNVYVNENSIVVLKENSSVTLTFNGVANSETYINLQNFKLNPYTPFDVASTKTKFTGDEPSLTDQLSNMKNMMKWVSPTTIKVIFASDGQSAQRTISTPTPSNHMYGSKDDWTISMGYTEKAQTKITITFDKVGEYTFDDLSVVCQPMSNVDDYVNELNETPVTNYTESTNCISAHVDASETKVVYFSTPYTNGWSATVDGKPAEITRANTAFMCVSVDAGSHDIELHFESPGIKQGVATTVLGIVAFVGLVVFRRIRRGRK